MTFQKDREKQTDRQTDRQRIQQGYLPDQYPLFSALASAPCFSRTLTLSTLPSVTAKCKGVRPLGSTFSISC